MTKGPIKRNVGDNYSYIMSWRGLWAIKEAHGLGCWLPLQFEEGQQPKISSTEESTPQFVVVGACVRATSVQITIKNSHYVYMAIAYHQLKMCSHNSQAKVGKEKVSAQLMQIYSISSRIKDGYLRYYMTRRIKVHAKTT